MPIKSTKDEIKNVIPNIPNEGVGAVNEGDYVIDENYRLLKVKSIEERENGNLRYNFTNGKFGLKDETNLGNPNGRYVKVDVSQCGLA